MRPLVLTLVFSFLSFNSYAVGGKLFEIFTNSNLAEALYKNIDPRIVTKRISDIDNSLKYLGLDQFKSSKSEFLGRLEILERIVANDPNIQAKNAYLPRISKLKDGINSHGEISKDKIDEALDTMVLLAGRYGNGPAVLRGCGGVCAIDAFSQAGIGFTLEVFSASSVVGRAVTQIPNRPEELNRFIVNKLTSLNLGRYVHELVPPEDEKALAVFLKLAEQAKSARGNNPHLEYVKSVLKYSGDDGLFEGTPHKFWRVASSGEADEDTLRYLTGVLDESSSGSGNPKERFYQALEKDAKTSLQKENAAKIRSQDCFFR